MTNIVQFGGDTAYPTLMLINPTPIYHLRTQKNQISHSTKGSNLRAITVLLKGFQHPGTFADMCSESAGARDRVIKR